MQKSVDFPADSTMPGRTITLLTKRQLEITGRTVPKGNSIVTVEHDDGFSVFKMHYRKTPMKSTDGKVLYRVNHEFIRFH